MSIINSVIGKGSSLVAISGVTVTNKFETRLLVPNAVDVNSVGNI